MKKIFTNMISAIIAITISSCVFSVIGCSRKQNKLDSEKDAVVISTTSVEGVFSPFFATAGTDISIESETQIAMLASDNEGNITYGEKEPVVTLDYATQFLNKENNVVTEGVKDGYTLYQFVIKKGIKFSDGKDLTIKDVLFNLYTYLDPVYTGASTVYSVNIEGLNKYRSLGLSDDDGYDAFDEKASVEAQKRVDNIIKYCNASINSLTTEEKSQVKKDLASFSVLLKDELTSDFYYAGENLETYKKEYVIEKPWQAYLLMEGLVEYLKDESGKYIKEDGKYKLDFTAKGNEFYLEGKSEKECIDTVYKYYINDETFNSENRMPNTVTAFKSFNSGSKMQETFKSEAKSKIIEELKNQSTDFVPMVSGITVQKGSNFVGNNKYDDSYDILQIRIKGTDPKAIWSFGFTVSPMHYYSNSNNSSEFNSAMDYNSFKYPNVDGVDASYNSTDISVGFPMGNYSYFTNVIQAVSKVPMGAGVYKCSTGTGYNGTGVKEDGTPDKALENGFYSQGKIYFERNEYFETTGGDKNEVYNAKIKYLQFKEVDNTNTLETLKAGGVYYGEPNCTEENLSKLNSAKNLSYKTVRANGYGYIGINAKYVKSINIRRAIMSCMDVSLFKSYYPGELCELLKVPMTTCSWVYNNTDGSKWIPTAKYSYKFNENSLNENKEYAVNDDYISYMEKAMDEGYRKVNGIWKSPEGTSLSYTFTIAGTSEDHPAYQTLATAAKVLNSQGWNITIKTDSRALSKLTSGSLAVWAAAWSSTIDPDMYQVYHMDSQTTSTTAWGYQTIKADTSSEDYVILSELSNLIDKGRATFDRSARTTIYREALDKIMSLAIEFPTYNRNNLYVWNSSIIDSNTLVKDFTSFYEPLAKIWKVDFVK